MGCRKLSFSEHLKKDGITRGYQYSLFECPSCKDIVERVRKDGLKANACSHKCSRTGKRRGAYKDKVEISGYLYVYTPDHPDATKSGYVAEHRLIAENKLGRRIKKDEDVHHINGDKHDNDPENLDVLTSSEHSRLHALEGWRNENGKFAL